MAIQKDPAGLHIVEQLTGRHAKAQAGVRQTGVPKLLCIALVVYGALFSALILTHPFGGRAFLAVSDVASIVPPLAAGVLSLIASARSIAHARLGWRFVGAGCLAWAAGECLWAVYEAGLQQEPFPSPADAGYLAMLPLVALGLTMLTSEGQGLSRSRLTLEGLSLVLAAVALVWFYVVHPTYSESSASVLEKVIGAAYPIGDLVLCYAVVIGIQRQWGERDALVLTTLLGGLAFLVAADVGFAYQNLDGTYTDTSLVNIGWPLGFLLIALTATLSASWTLTYNAWADAENSQTWRHLLPVTLLIPLTVVVASAFQDETFAVAIPLAVLAVLSAAALALRCAIGLGLVQEAEWRRARILAFIEGERSKAA